MDEDYPRTLLEFDDRFRTEAACWTYLVWVRWPQGFRCPRCGHRTAWSLPRSRLFECRGCHAMVSVTAGTVFHRSHLSLRVWFRAIWLITNQKSGVSAVGLQRALGLGSYETAWTCLHKLRRAMVRPGREPLSGEVEVDETFVGGVEPGGGKRHVGTKALVAIAAEVSGTGIGRIRMRRIPDASAQSLEDFVQEAVAPGAVVITDGWTAYPSLERRGYVHRPRVVRTSGQTASTLLPRVHRVAALLKRWLLGSHQGRISRDHLGDYLDEFTFRFNRRLSRHRGKLFYRLLQQAVAIDPVPYKRLVVGRLSHGHT